MVYKDGSGHRSLSSFSSHSLMFSGIVLSQVLNSILKSVEDRHFDINIYNANLNQNILRNQRLCLRLRYDIPNYKVKIKGEIQLKVDLLSEIISGNPTA